MTGDERYDTLHGAGGIAIDADNARVGVRRTHEASMQSARNSQIVEKMRGACQEAAILSAKYPAADRSLVTPWHGMLAGHRHYQPPHRPRAAVASALVVIGTAADWRTRAARVSTLAPDRLTNKLFGLTY